MEKVRTFTLLLVLSVCFITNPKAQVFHEMASKAGIHHQFRVFEGLYGFGGGACVFDYNNDGLEDIFIAGGMADDALYLNKGKGVFENKYLKAGLKTAVKYVSTGAVSADFNKDGWRDLFVTTINTANNKEKIPRAINLLFINNKDGTFSDATKEYELDKILSFSTAAMVGDVNADGYPDIYVGNYFREFSGTISLLDDDIIVSSNQMAKGNLFINRAGKRFVDLYDDYHLNHKGFGFGGVFTDFDNDHDPDLIINNDFGYKNAPNKLLENKFPHEYFEDVSVTLKMNIGINAMGTAVGDYNNDGLLDYYITNIRANSFMVNQGPGKPFVNRSKELGTSLNTVVHGYDAFQPVSWGANFADFDNDGDLDLFVANGCLNPYVEPNPDYYFENSNGRFLNRSIEKKVDDKGISRGSVVFDADNDGDLDLLVVNQAPVSTNFPDHTPTLFYLNDSVTGHWLKVQLKGIQADNDGIGSRVEISLGNRKMIREIDGGSSHSSQNSTIAHFGTGTDLMIDTVRVIWTGGKQQLLLHQAADQLIVITENNLASKGTAIQRQLLIGLLIILLTGLTGFIIMRRHSRKIKN